MSQKTEAEEADLDKNKGYAESLKSQFRDYDQYLILLVTDAEKKEYDGFSVLRWREVSLTLRRIIATGSLRDQPFFAGMILGFAGTVEQTLLGFSSLKAPLENSAAISYLERHLSVGGDHE